MQSRPKKRLEQVSDALRLRHYSYRTEQAYCDWIKRYILFHNKTHPKEMGTPEVEAFLNHLVHDGIKALPSKFGYWTDLRGSRGSGWIYAKLYESTLLPDRRNHLQPSSQWDRYSGGPVRP